METINQAQLKSRRAVVLDALERAWSRGDVAALDAVLAPSFVRRGRSTQISRDQLKESILEMRRAFPDLSLRVVRVVENHSEMALWWTSEGTFRNTFRGIRPTGRAYSISGATFATFHGELISEESVFYDRRGEYASLGVPLFGGRDTSALGAGSAVDPDTLRALHRKVVTGVTVVTADPGNDPRGLVVNAFSSVSLEPPLILICVQKSSATYPHLLASRYFGVNILAADQSKAAHVFATKLDRKFDHVDWYRGDLGVPLLFGTAASMEIEVQDILHVPTHTVFVGRAERVTGTDAPPLIYVGGSFFDGGRLAAATGS